MAKSQDSKEDTKPDEVKVKSAPKINDVAKPGETAATPTSRPIIAEHRPMIKMDPMVVPVNDDKDKTPPKEKKMPHTSTVATINPLPKDDTPKEEQEKEPEEKPKAEKAETAPSEPEEKKPSDNKNTDQYEADDSASEAGAIEALASSAEQKKLAEKQAEEQEKQDAKIGELIASKKYLVPITEGGREATGQRFLTWLLVLVILAAVGFVLAIDAGYLDIGVKLPFDLIKNN